MKKSLPLSIFVFASMISTTGCEGQKFSFAPADNIDGLNVTDPGSESDPRRG